ncbi:hypothetical protein ES703_45677 [subsurface metagenome]
MQNIFQLLCCSQEMSLAAPPVRLALAARVAMLSSEILCSIRKGTIRAKVSPGS